MRVQPLSHPGARLALLPSGALTLGKALPLRLSVLFWEEGLPGRVPGAGDSYVSC